MRLLLDTHTFLWLLARPDRLTAEALGDLRDLDNELFVSAASALEVATKQRIGRLSVPGLIETWRAKVESIRAVTLDVSTEHALLAGSITWEHRDPFDRLLVGQAIVENMTLATQDRALLSFQGVRTLRAR